MILPMEESQKDMSTLNACNLSLRTVERTLNLQNIYNVKRKLTPGENKQRWMENLKEEGTVILTGLTVSRSCTSSTTRLVDKRRGNLDKVSFRDICSSCSSSFLLSQKNNTTRTTMPADCWLKNLVT